VTALARRDEGGPRSRGKLLVYPSADLGLPATPSLAAFGEGYGLGSGGPRWFWDKYLAPSDGAASAASPMHAPDLRGLPPALVVTAEYDPLRDDGERYAARLREAGVPTTVSRYDGRDPRVLFPQRLGGQERRGDGGGLCLAPRGIGEAGVRRRSLPAASLRRRSRAIEPPPPAVQQPPDHGCEERPRRRTQHRLAREQLDAVAGVNRWRLRRAMRCAASAQGRSRAS
jgi:acetyl esterase/lipase